MTGIITAEVKAKVLNSVTDDYNLNLYVVEDSVKGFGVGWDQENGENFQPGHTYSGAGEPMVGFNHRRVVRAMLGGSFGAIGLLPANSPVGFEASKKYTYKLAVGNNYRHFKLVALVQKNDPFNVNNRAINNAVEAKVVKSPLSISSGPSVSKFEIFPNPSTGDIRLIGAFIGTTNLRVNITNTLGQVVFTREIPYASNGISNASLNISSLSNGVYFVIASGAEGRNVSRVVLRR